MLRRLLRPLVPPSVRTKISRLQRARVLRRQFRVEPRRIVIGSSGVFEPGWIPTDAREFDLLQPSAWERFISPDSVDAMVAEHVWEHLSFDEGKIAARTCHRFLRPGGYIRVAVPDGLFPDPDYQEYIKPGGAGGGEGVPHKVVYTHGTLVEVFESSGFTTTLLEFHDETGQFHGKEWKTEEGMVHRSKRFDARGPISIILDAKKS